LAGGRGEVLGGNMSTVDNRITVASMLAGKLPREIVALAKPLDERCAMSLTLSLEPWIEFSKSERKIEVHVREGGDVELHVFVTGRKRNPRKSFFPCKAGDHQAFTDYLARNIDALVAKLS
jgi:hypothetical protein